MRQLIAILFAALGTGCFTNTVSVLETPDSETYELAADEGLVLVQVADTTPLGQNYPANYVTFAARDYGSEANDKRPRIPALKIVAQSTTWFLAALPQNEYSVSSIRSYYQVSTGYYSKFYPADIELGTFNVEAGKITNLGVIALYIERSGSDYLYASTRASADISPSAKQHIRERYADLIERVDNFDTPLTWLPDGFDVNRDAAYRTAVSRQVTFSPLYIGDNGATAVFPGHLGSLLYRFESGEWKADAIAEDLRIVQFTQSSANEFVLTELGDVYMRRTGEDAEWLVVDLGTVRDQVAFLTPVFDERLLIVTKNTSEKELRFISFDLATSEWEQITQFRPKSGFWSSFFAAGSMAAEVAQRSSIVRHGDFIYVATRFNLFRYSIDSGLIEELDATSSFGILGQNNALVVNNDFMDERPRPQASFDYGETWQRVERKIDSPEKVLDYRRRGLVYTNVSRKQNKRYLNDLPVFLDSSIGFATHQVNNERENRYLLQTVDGGRSWSPLDTPLPEGCATIEIVDPRYILLRCFLSGEFYRSEDSGRSWVLDREASEL